MTTIIRTLTCVLVVLVWDVAYRTAEAQVKAGFAERDITPDIGMEQPGGYHKSFHRSFHDPCKVRVAVFDDGQRRVAVIGVDALAVPGQFVKKCRQRLQDQVGLPPEAVLIAASHSHSSGPVGMVQPGEYDHASPLVQKLAYEDSSMANPEYLKRLEEAIVEAVSAANEKRSEVACGFGSGCENQVAFNRRFRMRNGETYTHPGAGNPEIVEVAGPTDPEVGVIRPGTATGSCWAASSISPATPRPARAAFPPTISTTSSKSCGERWDRTSSSSSRRACGDVTQVDNLTRYQNRGPEDFARFVGGRVGAEAVKVLLSVDKGNAFKVDFRSKVLKIERRVPSPGTGPSGTGADREPEPEGGSHRSHLREGDAAVGRHPGKEPVADVEVQAVQIGPAVFVSNPAEYFCQYGLDIKKGSKFPLTFPVELANGCVGYVPTEEALGEHGGGYETRLTSYSNLIPTAGTTIANEGIALTGELTPDAIPTRPPIAPFQGPGWPYGNVPPQVN